jgi:hypothetical protein
MGLRCLVCQSDQSGNECLGKRQYATAFVLRKLKNPVISKVLPVLSPVTTGSAACHKCQCEDEMRFD